MVIAVITSYGTLGDNLPLIALGQLLKTRGYRVRMAISESMHPYALRAGLEVVSNGRRALGQQEAQQQAKSWNHLSRKRESSVEEFCTRLRIDLTQSLPYIASACEEADLLISTPQQDMVAAIIHEILGIPWISVSVTPSLHCWEPKQPKTLPTDEATTNSDQPSLIDPFYEQIQQLRQTFGLAELPRERWETYGESERLILASSPHFSQPIAKYSYANQTGFWFYEAPEWDNWQPDRELQRFMEQEPKPLVLSFSSQPLEDSGSVVEVHVRAAAELGRPIFIQQGWAGFNESHLTVEIDRKQVMFAGFMPQDWLFSHAAALIHHGGIGSTARALRNGCPMLVEPYGNDQFFNAKQIVLHGVGAAMHPLHLRADAVARVLQEKVLTPDYRQRTEAIGALIRAEQGLKAACEVIERWLTG